MSVASELDRAEQVAADVALLHDMAAGRLDEQRAREAAQVLLEHRRRELPSVACADYSSVLVRRHAGIRGGCRRVGPVCGHRGARSVQDR
jgi:hypothetical protein